MGFTRRELIQFLDGLVELASEENKVKAVLAKEKFISDFEKIYGYEKEVITEGSKLPPHYISAMPDSVQEEIRQKVIAALTEHGECTPENVDRAMSSKIYDLEDLIDIREYVERMEANRGRKRSRKGGATDDSGRNYYSSSGIFAILFPCKISRAGRQKNGGDIQAFRQGRGGWRGWELT